MATGVHAERPVADRGRDHLRVVVDPDAWSAGHVGAQSGRDHHDWVVDGVAAPLRGEPVDAGELPARHRERGIRRGLHQQHRGDHPGNRDPHHDRGVRCLRIRLDQLPIPWSPVRRRRGTPGRAPPDGIHPGPAAVRPGRAERHVPRHLAGAHGVRPAAGHLPALQLHVAAATRPVRVGRHRRRVAFPGVHTTCAAAVDPGHRRLRDLPVPVGLERPPGGADLPRHRRGPTRPAVSAQCADREPRWAMAPPDRRCIHDDARAAGGLPAAPASIRARDPGRLRQG